MFSKSLYQVALVFTLLLSIFSCAPSQRIHHLYSDKRKSAEQVAIIQISEPSYLTGVFPTTSQSGKTTTIWHQLYFAPTTRIVSIDGDSIEKFIGKKELFHEDKYSVLPGEHKIGVSYDGLVSGEKTKATTDRQFSGGITELFNIFQKIEESVILNAKLNAGTLYLLQAKPEFDTCTFNIVSNGVTIATKEVTNLKVTGDKELILLKTGTSKK